MLMRGILWGAKVRYAYRSFSGFSTHRYYPVFPVPDPKTRVIDASGDRISFNAQD
jgi:hypothetical protein